jgi:hypothetical protein
MMRAVVASDHSKCGATRVEKKKDNVPHIPVQPAANNQIRI